MQKNIKDRWFRCLLALILASLVLPARIHQPVHAASGEVFTHRLTQSTPAYQFWTAPPSEKVFKNTSLPAPSASQVKVYAARNEFEPFQVVVKPAASGNINLSLSDFGAGISVEIFQVRYIDISAATDYTGRTGPNPDPLWPISNGDSVAVTANENTAFWFSLFVPKTAPGGDYNATLTLGGVAIPIQLHVFNFAIPDELHVKSQMNFSYQTVLQRYGAGSVGSDEYWTYIEKIKQYMIDHRLTPKSVLWSGGLTTNGAAPYIGYDCNTGQFTDTDGIWGFEQPAARYLAGSGLMSGQYALPFNGGVGFPSFMAATFQNNDASADQRPATFCGQTRSGTDWYTANNPSTPYNQKWFQYITAIQDYLAGLGYLDQGYYYFANEPQDQADYDAVAWYSAQLAAAAPNLKRMVSEEPKPEIYANPGYPGAKIDIWLAHFGIQFDPAVALDRLQNHQEETWIYFLKSTYYPRFNPFTIDHPGVDAKFSGWFLWKYRLRGLAYYSFNDWGTNPWTSPNPNGQNGELAMLYPPSENNANISYGANGHRFVPSIRLELLRDGLEDYEYFYLLNGGQQPQPYLTNPADAVVDKIIGGVQAYNRDGEMMYNLRRLVGLKIGGEITSIPELVPPSVHPRSDGAPGSYYLNFQDPAGEPAGTVIYNGHTYMKIGSALYSAAAGYGWYRAADVPPVDLYAYYDPWFDVQPTILLRSSVIEDWGRDEVFEFDLPNGAYNVTVGVGYRNSTRPHKIVVEGVTVIDNETTNNSAIIRTQRVLVHDKRLTLVMGMYKETAHINFLDIEPAPASSVYLPVVHR